MTDENKNTNASGETQGGGASPEPQGETLESLKAEIEKLKKHNAEILSEKKGVSQKAAQLEKEKQEKEEAELRAKGDLKALLEKGELREKELRAKLEEISGKFKSTILDVGVRDLLLESGCNRDKVSTLMNFKPVANYGEKLSWDENFKIDKKSATSFIEEIKKELPEFFSQKAPDMKDVNPARTDSLSKEELYEKEVKACKTISELELVKKKHGKA